MILRTELRRSTAPVTGIVVLAGALGLIYSLSGPWWKGTASWDQQWTGLAQWTRYITAFLWPVVLGIGALQGMRDKRSRVTELFATTPKPAWRRVLPTTYAVAIAFTAACVVLLAVGGVQVAGTATYFHLKWLPVAGVLVLALVGIALLGAGIGRLLPWLVVPPVLAIAALAVQAAVTVSGPHLLTPAFTEVDISAFTTVPLGMSLVQALWFIGIGATGFILFFATGVRARVAAVVPLALAAVVAAPYLSTVDHRVVPDPDARALVCDDSGPRVCVTRVHADYLSVLVGPGREALALLRKLPSPPTSVEEMSSNVPYLSPPDVALVYLDTGLLPSPDELRFAVLAGSSGPSCESNDPDFFLRREIARTVATSWLTGTLAPMPGYEYEWRYAHDEIQQAWQALRALPPDEQPARVEQLRNDVQHCREPDLGVS